ncbi:MAG: hypothetical protein ABR903_09110 [Thermodesulfovibrionales bacterium]|jgi:hypothetical protein
MNGIDTYALSRRLNKKPELPCPYFDLSDVCNASLSSTSPSTHIQKSFCNSDDFDDCPIFLAKVLRGR